MNLNKVFLLGNLTREPEIRSLPSGQQLVTFGLATNRFYLDNLGERKQETEFHNIVCFGKLADIASKYLKKGSLALIEGRIRTRNWVNPQGIKQYRTEIIAQSLQLGPKDSGDKKSITEAPQIGEEISEIPVIEENYISPEQVSPEEQSQDNLSKNNPDEIDVKEIPF